MIIPAVPVPLRVFCDLLRRDQGRMLGSAVLFASVVGLDVVEQHKGDIAVSDQLTRAVEENPLSGQGFSPDTVMGKWVRIAAALVISGRSLESGGDFNPVAAMAQTLTAGYGLAVEAARLRAAQIVAAALGWRIFEDYLVEAGGLGDVPLETLREELARSARRLGATPWPSPPAPPAHTG